MENNRSQKALLAAAWTTILAVNLFPIVAQEIFGFQVSENLNYGFGGAVVLAGLLLAWLWPPVKPLREFFSLFTVLLAAQWLAFTKIDQIPWVKSLMTDPSFDVYMPAEVTLKLLVTLAVLAFLFAIKRERKVFFLAKGDLTAPVEPVKWLGVKSGARWNQFGGWLALFLSLGTLTFLVLSGRPTPDMVVRALPYFPAVLFAATLNAFNEEMTYKASFLSVLENTVGKKQALALMAVLFGIMHYYGIPYGIIGVLMATFLGWLLGKSMLETRGLFWAWLLHILQDVLIFGFLAIHAVTPGGG